MSGERATISGSHESRSSCSSLAESLHDALTCRHDPTYERNSSWVSHGSKDSAGVAKAATESRSRAAHASGAGSIATPANASHSCCSSGVGALSETHRSDSLHTSA